MHVYEYANCFLFPNFVEKGTFVFAFVAKPVFAKSAPPVKNAEPK